MKVLLIWENIPEHTQAYEFPEGSKLALLAKEAHGYYVDAESNDAADELNEALNDDNMIYDTRSSNHEYIQGGPWSAVYISGFVM